MLEMNHQLGDVRRWGQLQCELHINNAQNINNFQIMNKKEVTLTH